MVEAAGVEPRAVMAASPLGVRPIKRDGARSSPRKWVGLRGPCRFRVKTDGPRGPPFSITALVCDRPTHRALATVTMLDLLGAHSGNSSERFNAAQCQFKGDCRPERGRQDQTAQPASGQSGNLWRPEAGQ